jgi:glycosyltransferase involved in cell wall biosynthesis
MDTEKKLSFIVPVYNTEKYISRCLDSLIAQDLQKKDYDIIVVDDGSTDKSRGIVEEYVGKYNNIILIIQQNTGLSAARNAGINHAKSKYVWFVDSDDWIAENCIALLIKIAETNVLDAFCVAPSRPFNGNFKNEFRSEMHLAELRTGIEVLKYDDYPIGAWCYILKKKMIIDNKINFLHGVYFEDEDFTPKVLYYAKRIILVTDMSVYSYFIRQDSICRTISEKHVLDKLTVSFSLSKFLNNKVQEDDSVLRGVFEGKIYHMFLSGLNEALLKEFDKCVLTKYIEKAKRLNLYPLKYKAKNIKEFMIIKMLNISPFFYGIIRRVLQNSRIIKFKTYLF